MTLIGCRCKGRDLSEYGTRLKGDAAASGAYYAEHYDVIVKKDALKVLQNL